MNVGEKKLAPRIQPQNMTKAKVGFRELQGKSKKLQGKSKKERH
jgi:hypothetical protein